MNKVSNKHLVLCVYPVLAVIALVVYWQIYSCDFIINYDDNRYVTENHYVKTGLTQDNIIWAFTSAYASNWHPLTWLSHMLDCQLFGTNPGRHHLTNLLFHIANTLLLFAVLNQMTGTLWQSAFVAALFALHPLHVESVAWISERKDVLSTLFWFLTIVAYLHYVRRPGAGRYLLVLLLFALGLMAKPMLVTLPFVLLLLDYWPLERFQLNQNKQRPVILRLVREKIPFLVLSAASSIITFFAQRSGGSVAEINQISLYGRTTNAVISYLTYIGKMFWPSRLAIFYPHPLNAIPLWQVIAVFLLLICISVWVIRLSSKHRYLSVGWFWYIGTLVPVIGLVQVGGQAFADRYTYIPLIGLFMIIAWGLPDLLSGWKYRKTAIGILSLAALSALSVCTYFQVGYWRNGKTLFEHALKVTKNNYVAHYSLGQWLYNQGLIDQAIGQNLEALRIDPNQPFARTGLGVALGRQGRLDEAIAHLTETLRINPDYALAHAGLGIALGQQGRFDESVKCLTTALRIRHNQPEVHSYLGYVLIRQGKFGEAIEHLNEALRLKPDLADAHNHIGFALTLQGKSDEAITHFTMAMQLDPGSTEARHRLALVLIEKGRIDEAILHLKEVLRIKPLSASPMNTMAWLLATHKETKFYNPQQAVQLAQRACELTKYQDASMVDTLAASYAAAGKFPEAVSAAEKALSLAESLQLKNVANEIRNHLRLYKASQPYIEPPPK